MTEEEKLQVLLEKAEANNKKLNSLLNKNDEIADYEATSEGVRAIFPKSKPYETLKAKYAIPLFEKRQNINEADRIIRNIEAEIEKVNVEMEKDRGVFNAEVNAKRSELRNSLRLLKEQLKEAQTQRANIHSNGKLDEIVDNILNNNRL